MALVVYQIGDIPVFDAFKGSNDGGVEVGLQINWRNPEGEFSNTPGRISFLPRTRSLTEPIEVELSGSIFPTDGFSIQGFINSIKSMGGRRNTPVIAFRAENPDAIACDGCDLPVDWLINYGVITSVEVEGEIKSLEASAFEVIPFSIKMSLDIRWTALPSLLWEYRPWNERFVNPTNPLNAQVGIDQIFIHPLTFNEMKPNSFFYRWQSELTLFNPIYWGEKYGEGRRGGIGSDFTEFGQYPVYADPAVWPADPASIYAFTELANTGTLNIAVTKASGYFVDDTEAQLSTLNLSNLDADLAAAGYGGLLGSDILYTGLVQPYPGFILRDGVKLTVARPKWSYPGTYPGETGRGYTSINIYGDGTVGKVAYLHDFGV